MLFGKKDDVIISNDALPLLFATLVQSKTMYEMHDFATHSFLYRTLLRRVRWVLATNEWKRERLIADFGVPAERIVVERNAVDVSTFGTIDKHDARIALGLSADEQIAMYTGHLYEWKGADTLAAAAALIPDATIIFVGGTEADVARFKNTWASASNIRIVGHVAHDQIPLWQAAADVLVLPNSGKEEISVHYTSPMKLFEYMASGRPIVASDLPSIREILPKDSAFYVAPDNAEALAKSIHQTFDSKDEAGRRADGARARVAEHSWVRRADRIIGYVSL